MTPPLSPTPRQQLRQLMSQPGIIPTLAPHDVFSALVMVESGLRCLFLGGFGTSASLLGLPDLNLITVSEMAEAIRRMTARISVPVIADGDTGHGDLHNVRRTVELFEAAGAAGILLEDQVTPKRCGHFPNKPVVSREEFTRRIRTAVQARRDPQFVIFARTDARQTLGLQECLDRIRRCIDVGADAGFVEAPQSLEELEAIPRSLPVPMLANMLSGGTTPIVTVPALGAMGYKFAVAPIESLTVTGKAIQELTRTWLTQGRVDELSNAAMSFGDLKKMLRVDELLQPNP